MNFSVNKRLLLLSFFAMIGCVDLNAQVLQKVERAIRSHQNISYTDIVRIKFHFQEDFTADTLTSQVMPIANEPIGGGYYLVKNTKQSYAFDGNKLVKLYAPDSTYKVEKEPVEGQNTRTLLYWAKNIAKLSQLPAAKIRQLQDTVIHNVTYTNILVTEKDTLINNEHQYNATHFIIDQQSYLPKHILIQMEGTADDGSLMKILETHSYSNYRVDQKSFPDLSSAIIPAHFKTPPKRVPAVFLPNGTPAPAIKAIDPSGKAFNLDELKGKTVLINFSLVGCPHCVGAAQMLNRLHEKYKEKGLVIVNIYPLDQKDAIMKFDHKENVKTTSYTSEKSVQQTYPFDGYPSFYLIDQNGKVAQSYKGFYKGLESEIASALNGQGK
jgi:thiol-disulfide isomerase/thioredoxin